MLTLAGLACLASLARAATVQTFAPPAPCPTCLSDNYHGMSNGSLKSTPLVPGLAYDRFITIWLENTDYSSAAAQSAFQQLAAQGILLTNYNGVTHPSEPNYVAAMAGDFFGMDGDSLFELPENVSSIVDVLEEKNISWATYQENMPYDGDGGFAYAQPNYLNASAGNYTYYVRKHDPSIIFHSVAAVPDRALRVRNFNDFAVDVNASAIPSWVWITPNLVNDGHDTDATFCADWLNYFMPPLLNNTNFNSDRTLIHITFDENESHSEQNTVYTLLLGGAIPKQLRGTNDSTFYTHYSMMSSVQNNWGLMNLGRQDANKTMAAVWDFQANMTGYQNLKLTPAENPMVNLTGVFAGPANPEMWTPVLSPNVSAMGAGNRSCYYNKSATDTSMTSYAAVNLTAMNVTDPESVVPNYDYSGDSVESASGNSSSSAKTGTVASSSESTMRLSIVGVSLFAGVLAISALL